MKEFLVTFKGPISGLKYRALCQGATIDEAIRNCVFYGMEVLESKEIKTKY